MPIAAIFPALARDEVFRLETRRMWLRWPQVRDASAIARWVGKPCVALQTSTFSVGMQKAEVEKKIEAMRHSDATGRSLGFVLTLKGRDDNPVGMAGAHQRDDGAIELGYHLDPAVWNQGLMTEALSRIAEMVFVLTPAPEIMAGVRPDNLASRRVLEKVGFTADGGYEHESPLYGRFAVKRYRLARQRTSPLFNAMERHGRELPKLAFDLGGRI